MSVESLTELPQPIEDCLPVEKSWYGNLGLLALLEESPLVIDSVRNYGLRLPDDVRHMVSSSEQILSGDKEIYVGEGGAWARKISYANAKYDLGLTLIKDGTLVGRPDEFTPDLLYASVDELRKLNKHSSQLASAAVLTGSPDPMPVDASYHLRMAYEARDFWEAWPKDQPLPLRRDSTLRRQTLAALNYMRTGRMHFEPIQAEDYPFACTFGLMNADDALDQGWGNLAGHESDRLETTEHSLQLASLGRPIPYADHRILQPLRFKYGPLVQFEHEQAISKSWPLPDFNRAFILCQQYALAA
jgi:hypothetical protein